MNTSLFEQFLREECTPHVRGLLEAALADEARIRAVFEFNRFEITVERSENKVVIEDVLDTSTAGVQRLTLAEFIHALTHRG